MTLQVCWNTQQIHKVMDTDALHVDRHIFLATHHPIQMYKQSSGVKVHSQGAAYDENTFLHDFLDKKEHVFVPILGESGTGKSHLVRWLEAQIDPSGRKVLLIPRLTNLKEIILMILEGLEGHVFDEYRQRVQHAVGNVTLAQAKEMLHNNITLAIGPNGNHSMERLDDFEHYFIDNLPYLFRDPALLREWFKEDGIIHLLAEHIIGGNGGRLNERREFTVEDLPLNISFINQASDITISTYSDLVGDNELQQRAVNWINQNLDQAISAMLSLSSTDLVKLMNQVRAELARRDIELILLIEDFTVLQGIDYQLLDALIYKAAADQTGEDKLCDMRVALGCTTGYFKRFEDTILTRIDFRVMLDVGEELVPSEEIERFAAKYLNAIRMPEARIVQWSTEEGKEKTLQSACSDLECPYIHQCHEAFGEVDGIGLYPFNRIALHSMYERSTKETNFNPRLLISKVLRYITENYAGAIGEGLFPPSSLFDHFGGKTENRLNTITRREMETKDPIHFDRRNVLIELWTNGYELVDLHPYVHESFKLPILNRGTTFIDSNKGIAETSSTLEDVRDSRDGIAISQSAISSETSTKSLSSVKESVRTGTAELGILPTKVEELLRKVDSWGNEGIISQHVTQDLRDLVFEALNNFIAWDSVGLNKVWFTEAGLWKKTIINFRSQSTQKSTGPIQLFLPQNGDKGEDTALALQGLIYFNHFKHWEFPKGPQYLRKTVNYLERWSALLLNQLRNIPLAEGAWDPLPPAIEVLGVTAAMGGITESCSSESLTMSLFNSIPSIRGRRSPQWDKLFNQLTLHRDDITKIATSRLAVVKGDSGTSRARVIDASMVMKRLKNLELGQLTDPPDDRISAFDKLIKCAQLIQNDLLIAIESERKDKVEWAQKMKCFIGEDLETREVAKLIKKALEGSLTSASLRDDKNKISTAANRLEKFPIKSCIKSIERLETKSLLDAAVELGRLPVDQIAELEESVNILDKFLDQSTQKVERDLRDLQTNEAVQNLEKIKVEIDSQFNLITECLRSFYKEDNLC
ncbi:protein DpdH [Paenibacillus sp. LS1]|uniref:protein DpdH n=1 Tax=Paenibacillus sp. LS1 TaxID=2992120 RepID=UPI002232B036|nr:protein DpdH [Paenibacillus sp. LS1]MCW3795385.1 protein DpdH [Paenibacillus sp. LS1]